MYDYDAALEALEVQLGRLSGSWWAAWAHGQGRPDIAAYFLERPLWWDMPHPDMGDPTLDALCRQYDAVCARWHTLNRLRREAMLEEIRQVAERRRRHAA